MTLLEYIFLGLIQGVGEFLPISSSAHLVIFPYFLGRGYQGLQFDVMLHLGTLLAIIIFFFRDWIKILKDAVQKPGTSEGNFLWLLVLATVPAGVIGLAFEKQAEEIFRNPFLVAANLIFFSFVILWADKKAKNSRDASSFSAKDALLLGLAQSIAILPGASRSGMTIMAALFLGYKRFDAARISFLMATPVILGAGLLEAGKLDLSALDSGLAAAFISSLFFGIFSIKFLMDYLKDKNLTPFIIYRIALGAGVFWKYISDRT